MLRGVPARISLMRAGALQLAPIPAGKLLRQIVVAAPTLVGPAFAYLGLLLMERDLVACRRRTRWRVVDSLSSGYMKVHACCLCAALDVVKQHASKASRAARCTVYKLARNALREHRDSSALYAYGR